MGCLHAVRASLSGCLLLQPVHLRVLGLGFWGTSQNRLYSRVCGLGDSSKLSMHAGLRVIGFLKDVYILAWVVREF